MSLNATAILDASILIVDDLAPNVQLLERMLASAGYRSVSSTMDPTSVCALNLANHYDLILLDLLMPEMDGFQVLSALREQEGEGYLPILVITAQPGHKLRALQAGAKDFISKPFELAEVLARVHNMLEVRLLHKQMGKYNSELEQRVKERTSELHDGYLETIFTMTRAAEHKDEDTGAHVQRISYYCAEVAKMLGMDAQFVDNTFVASPMHDIGKIGIPDSVLLKPSSLLPEEWSIMKGHTSMGAEILGNSRSPYLRMGAEIALNHHERWDGGGYPNGKAGTEIPLTARIVQLCDIYDALRSKRPYKPAYDHKKTVDILKSGDGRTQPTHFDPEMLTLFRKHHDVFGDIFQTHQSV